MNKQSRWSREMILLNLTAGFIPRIVTVSYSDISWYFIEIYSLSLYDSRRYRQGSDVLSEINVLLIGLLNTYFNIILIVLTGILPTGFQNKFLMSLNIPN